MGQMRWTDRQQQFKTALVAAALVVAAVSLAVSRWLANDLAAEEHRRMKIWAEALRTLNQADGNADLSLVLRVLEENNNIPVVIVDETGRVTDYRNMAVEGKDRADSLAWLARQAGHMKQAGHFVRIDGNRAGGYQLVCYDDSILLKRLNVWPWVQFGMVGVLMAAVVLAFLSFKRAEQNSLWVGLSKETAHQLGTPISSIMAWLELLKEELPDNPYIGEIGKDVARLDTIAGRFSKIGATPVLQTADVGTLLAGAADYIRKRTSSRVAVRCQLPSAPVEVRLCPSLFEWVVENLCKNAVDAMEGSGTLTIVLSRRAASVFIDVSDTGCGMSKATAKRIFTPGFTTKQRGWGLGLSLAKRIVEEYHRGSLSVKATAPGKGTTFRIVLRAEA